MLDKKICFVSSDSSGCYLYRVKQIADYLKQESMVMFPFRQVSENEISIGDARIIESDVIVLQRHVDPIFIYALPDLKGRGIKIVYDIDDLLWHIPATNNAHAAYGSKVVKTIDKIIKLCDHVTVSTEPLANYIRANKHPNVTVIPNMLPSVDELTIPSNNKVRIGFAGSNTHRGDFSFQLCQALRDLKNKYDIELLFLGYNPVKGYEHKEFGARSVESYYETLRSMNLDIGLCPLKDDTFNRSKSNIKFLEYTSCGAATIASNTGSFADTIKDRDTGILVNNEKEWFVKLEELIVDTTLRKSIITNAHNFVKDTYTYSNNGQFITDRWSKIVEELYDIR